MFAEIISIGDELLIGQTVNSNAAWLGGKLNEVGIRVRQVSTIADNGEQIVAAMEEASGRAQLILITGGLGPTRDDITKETLADFFETKLIFSEEIYENIKQLFRQSDREIGELNRSQAYIPANCIPIKNNYGTAPGMWFEKNGKIFVSMPGVPYEMQPMIEEFVIPRVKKHFKTPAVVHRTVYTQGIPESVLAEKIAPWEDRLPDHLKLAYLPKAGMVRLRLSGVGESDEKLKEEIDQQFSELGELIPGEIIGDEDEVLEMVIGDLLRGNGQTISTAESCTGGAIAKKITSVPGSSDYFKGSVVAYSNEIKQKLLKVTQKSLSDHGAVSREVVLEMAEGVKYLLNTDFAIATSGVAGPGGGSQEKPVGTTWIAIATPDKTIARHFRFGSDRGRNITRTTLTALNMLRKELM